MLWLYCAADIMEKFTSDSSLVKTLLRQFIAIMLGKDGSLEKRLPERVVRPTFIRKGAVSCLNKM